MKIPTKIKIEAACNQDGTRHTISEPWLRLDLGKPVLMATDGRIIAVVPVEKDEKDVEGYIPKRVLDDARKNVERCRGAKGRFIYGDAEVLSRKKWLMTKRREHLFKRKDNGNVPPKPEGIFKVDDWKFMTCINVKLLARLAQALNAENIMIFREVISQQEKDDGVMLCIPSEGNLAGRFGGIMSVRVHEIPDPKKIVKEVFA